MISETTDSLHPTVFEGYNIEQDSFSGPMDLLLHLIKKDEVDIFEIDITRLTDQYMEFIKTIDTSNIENAGDFLIMAASLLEIKSKALLPKEDLGEEGTEEEDLRANFIQQLLEYKKFKGLTQDLDAHQQEFFKTYPCNKTYMPLEEDDSEPAELSVSLNSLILAISKIARDASLDVVSKIRSSVTPLSNFMQIIREKITAKPTSFFEIKKEQNEPFEWISTFLAILELCKRRGINANQPILFGDIHIVPSGEKELDLSITSGQEFEENTEAKI